MRRLTHQVTSSKPKHGHTLMHMNICKYADWIRSSYLHMFICISVQMPFYMDARILNQGCSAEKQIILPPNKDKPGCPSCGHQKSQTLPAGHPRPHERPRMRFVARHVPPLPPCLLSWILFVPFLEVLSVGRKKIYIQKKRWGITEITQHLGLVISDKL